MGPGRESKYYDEGDLRKTPQGGKRGGKNERSEKKGAGISKGHSRK